MVPLDFLGSSDRRESARNVGDLGSIPGLGRSPGGGNGNPLQCSCLENPRDGGAWWATVYEVARSRTRLKQLSSSSSLTRASRWCGGKDSISNAGDAGDLGLIPGSGRSPGGGNGDSLQYSCLDNPMDRGAWWVIVHGVA